MKVVVSQLAPAVRTTLMLLGLVASGCVSHEAKTDPFFDQWRAKAETSKPYTLKQAGRPAAPAASEGLPDGGMASGATSQAPPAPGGMGSGQPAIDLPTKSLSVRFIEEDLATALRTLASIARQNILISPSVKGKLNLQTQETPWNTVFMGIITSYGLTVQKKDNMLHVMSMDDLKQQVEKETLQQQKKQVAELVTKVVPIEFSDPKVIADSVTQLLSKDKDGKPRGSATVDQHSRSLVIRESAEAMDTLLSLIRELDNPTSQVQIEAHIVETTKDVARELGVQWGALTNPKYGFYGNEKALVLTGSGKATYDGGREFEDPPQNPFLYEMEDIYNVNLGATKIKGINPASLGLLISAPEGYLAAQLSALQQNGKLNILSSPSIATLDNAEAVIESGKSVPVTTTTVSGGVAQTVTEYKDATLNLKVTPHVISERAIKLKILVKKDELDLTNVNAQGNPTIIKKNAQTQLIVENNATVVLAGLSKESQSGVDTGVPWLKDVPGLGWLFKKDSSSRNFEELLIFITPKILIKPEGSPKAEGEHHAGP